VYNRMPLRVKPWVSPSRPWPTLGNLGSVNSAGIPGELDICTNKQYISPFRPLASYATRVDINAPKATSVVMYADLLVLFWAIWNRKKMEKLKQVTSAQRFGLD